MESYCLPVRKLWVSSQHPKKERGREREKGWEPGRKKREEEKKGERERKKEKREGGKGHF